MEDLRALKPNQLDALREVANIGAGHAATALSQMIGETIMISVPMINIARLEEVPPQVAAPDEPVAAVLMHMLGDLTGRTLLVFPRRTAHRLASLLLRRPTDGPEADSQEFSEMDQSAIKEAGAERMEVIQCLLHFLPGLFFSVLENENPTRLNFWKKESSGTMVSGAKTPRR